MIAISSFVYVVAAYDEDTERVTCINVLTDLETARDVHSKLVTIYGGANVCLASRQVNTIDVGAPKEPPKEHSVVSGFYPRGGRWA